MNTCKLFMISHTLGKVVFSTIVHWQELDHAYHNLEQKICRLFHNLAQFLLTTSETELDYDHQKMNV